MSFVQIGTTPVVTAVPVESIVEVKPNGGTGTGEGVLIKTACGTCYEHLERDAYNKFRDLLAAHGVAQF